MILHRGHRAVAARLSGTRTAKTRVNSGQSARKFFARAVVERCLLLLDVLSKERAPRGGDRSGAGGPQKTPQRQPLHAFLMESGPECIRRGGGRGDEGVVGGEVERALLRFGHTDGVKK